MLGWFVALVITSRDADIALTPSTGPITTSVKIKPGTYTLADKNGSGALTVGADGITIDFQGAVLESPDTSRGRLETFNGVGLLIQDHKGVTIKNAHIHGFQYNLKVLRSSGVRLENCELSGSRSQKIKEGDAVNEVWLDLRGLDSWRTYGAAAWIEKSSQCLVQGLVANQSQNGLILVNSNDNRVIGCDFSYNSGWGIALCGSSRNLVCWNNADFVNRPWGGAWGGDSSGVVLTSGSNDNICAFNSFTHGGDGFFLATKNGGFDEQGRLHAEGRCDRNQVAFNDGSWSTANAFESTFSIGNVFYHNYADDSNYGFWLGFSNANLIQGNQIKRSHVDGIAHEQGSHNAFVNNDIEDTGGAAIHLWGGMEDRFSQSPSQANLLFGNHVVNAKIGLELKNSTLASMVDNIFRNAPTPSPLPLTKDDGWIKHRPYRLETMEEIRALRPDGFHMLRDSDLPKGWQWLEPTAYGMCDFRRMAIPWTMKDAKTLRLYLPPRGMSWRLFLPDWMVSAKGEHPRELLVTAKPNPKPYGEVRPFKFQVTGGRGTSQWISGHLLDLTWHIRWYKWFQNDHNAYDMAEQWKALFAGPALKEEDLPDLPEITGYQSPEPGLPRDHFALVGTTKIKLGDGIYRFDTISDDGIQVLLDGKMVVNNWTHHGATGDSGQISVTGGVHEIEVHYCQEDGGAALSVHWTKL
jgi:parallel beta-helix repeat protein